MVVLIICIWYLIGAFAMLYIFRKIDSTITRGDLITCFTIGGIAGLFSILYGLPYIFDKYKREYKNSNLKRWLDKKVF